MGDFFFRSTRFPGAVILKFLWNMEAFGKIGDKVECLNFYPKNKNKRKVQCLGRNTSRCKAVLVCMSLECQMLPLSIAPLQLDTRWRSACPPQSPHQLYNRWCLSPSSLKLSSMGIPKRTQYFNPSSLTLEISYTGSS